MPGFDFERDVLSGPRWRVVGTPQGSRVEVDGVDVTSTVRSVSVDMDRDVNLLTLTVVGQLELDVSGETAPGWLGLERVADPALVAELTARGWDVVSPAVSRSRRAG